MVLSFFQCHQALEHNLWFSRQYNILCMVATEIGPNLVKASKLIRFTRAVSVFVRQIKVFGKANRPSICWCLRFQHWAGRLKVLFDWEEDNPRLTDDKILWNVGILNKRRRLHSCNKRGQAVRKKNETKWIHLCLDCSFGLQIRTRTHRFHTITVCILTHYPYWIRHHCARTHTNPTSSKVAYSCGPSPREFMLAKVTFEHFCFLLFSPVTVMWRFQIRFQQLRIAGIKISRSSRNLRNSYWGTWN